MVTRFKVSLLITWLFSLSACSSTRLDIRTTPEGARVQIESVGSGTPVDVGKTPVSLPFSELNEAHQGSGPIVIGVDLDGYVKKVFLVTDVSRSDVTIQETLEKEPGVSDIEDFNQSIEMLFQAQKQVNNKNFDQALQILNNLTTKIPEVAATYEMLGGIYFLRNQKSESLQSYKKALALNSKSIEARRMIEIIRKGMPKRK